MIRSDLHLIIEKATILDAEQILALQKKSYVSEAEIYNNYTISPLIQTIEEIRRDFEKQVVLKIVIEDKLVGSVRAYENKGSCYIGKLIVHPDFQNRGLGTQLLCEVESRYLTVERFELFTGFKSERNLYLYQKLGYRIFRTEKVSNLFSLVYLEKYQNRG
ncbi:MAG: GNAT family N-acetyltransferase [Candidatus Margulisiibacteriota bacterium]|nr:MAG: GNAT family N-acetyltransferase [Candidatus Margulisbacteria bacterium GWD2_39_127]OGI05289.1 MAG: GNAT family N-acetyltransferase [Candidatus Margulisbacteria bacterium GWF2_38_17]OGI10852.1 MAG: GNAT family N-acetyltransferase [Candidatus Margulisbacteria bacterium GWE2_39_32]PZM83538.1 MAG: GNAT family N-acetyltransferase [Candidatus Margulisiibacteriota bacterium]HAR64284.1 GNAT family N-acetyltransferase [Candidatus Margulisiibacteriota bacterium]